MNPTGIGNGKSWNLHCFQDLVYSECADIVFVSETWLTGNILDTELLGQDYTIIRKDLIAMRGGGVLIAVKSSLFRSVKEFSTPASSDLELISVEVESALSQKILLCSCYRTKEADEKWMDSFKNFLNVSCSKFDTMLRQISHLDVIRALRYCVVFGFTVSYISFKLWNHCNWLNAVVAPLPIVSLLPVVSLFIRRS